MRYSNIGTGLGAVLVILSASMAQAGQRDATAKILGDMQGNNARVGSTYRAYSYAPAAAAPAETAQPSAQKPDNSTRSFSYEPSTSGTLQPANDRGSHAPGYLRAERKALGGY